MCTIIFKCGAVTEVYRWSFIRWLCYAKGMFPVSPASVRLSCLADSNYGGKIPIVCFAQGGGKETLKVSLALASEKTG